MLFLYTDGMQGFVKIIKCNASEPSIDITGAFRRFYIVAENLDGANRGYYFLYTKLVIMKI